MNLISWLFPQGSSSAALVGGGGKTTLLSRVADLWAEVPGPSPGTLIITTSTRLQRPCPIPSARVREQPSAGALLSSAARTDHPKALLWVAEPSADGRKWLSPPREQLDELIVAVEAGDARNAVLIEADGSAGRPIKAPGDGEPVIPRKVDTVVAVIGLSGFDCPSSRDTVHRLEAFCRLCRRSPGDIVDKEALRCLLTRPLGLFKGVPAAARRLVLFNQADALGLNRRAPKTSSLSGLTRAAEICTEIIAGLPGIDSAAVSSLAQKSFIRIIK